MPPIRPPPLKDSEWNPESPSKTKNFVIKCMPKGHHILSGFNKEEEKAFNPQGAMELLKRRFAKFTQPKEEKEQPNKRKRRRKKDDDDDEVFNYNEFYQSMRNPANLSMKRKKKANTNKKATPLFLPVIYRMDSKSIMNRMRNIEEKEKNKSNASRSSKSRRKGLNSDHEYDYDEEEFNDQNDEYKQKVAVSATLNDVYDRIVKCEAVNRIKLSRSGSRYSKSRSKRSFTSSKSSFARTNQRMRNNARGKFDRKKMMESIRANKDEIQLYLLAQQNVVQQLDSESSSEYYPEEEENLNSDNERSPRSSRIKSTRHSVRKSTRSHKTARDENGEYYYNYSDYSYNYDYEDYSDEENDKTHKGKKMKKHKYYRRRRNSNDEYSDYSYYSYYSEYTDEENEGKETHIQENIPESIQENIQNLVNTENEVVETEEEEVNEAHVSINDIAIEEEEEIYENIVDDQGNLIKVLSSRSNVKSSRSTQNTTNEGIVEEAKRKRKKRRHTKYINFSDTLDNRVNNENINNDESMYYSSEYYDSKKEEEEIVDFQDNDANGENLNNKFSKTAKKNDYNIDDSLNEIVQNKINKLANTVNIRSKHADKISLVDQDTQKPSYIPKLAISSIIPHDTLPKKNKHRIPIPQMPNTQPKPIVSHSMKYKNNGTSYRNMIQKRYPIDKLSASTRLTSRLLNQTDNPYENGLYSGTVVKTISSGVLPVKH
ncbi:hypothetical protein TRFO_13524 [Tritrichomonas foetus]|uniref:Uncharacterized protein n=1 Tax=Tritrichomonas foetus TaxID=1144522 RepID=A0A1J4KXQ4_9EUKA|nr:hypothetical protein TRFO_13524 [Tritrichomonas foetus]|eukprot:OHT16035.1 hypothetical protein TRFO_13524 [Tritrichomonas foetus]